MRMIHLGDGSSEARETRGLVLEGEGSLGQEAEGVEGAEEGAEGVVHGGDVGGGLGGSLGVGPGEELDGTLVGREAGGRGRAGDGELDIARLHGRLAAQLKTMQGCGPKLGNERGTL